MSVELAAGCALSSSQSVSVVPMIQWRPHGITNSTLVAVRRISPVSSWMRSRGTTMWTPFDARTRNLPRSPTRACRSSVHTPVALTTWWLWTSISRPELRSRTRTPVTCSPSRRKPTTGAFGGDGRAVLGRRAGDGEGVAGVVHHGVPVLDRAGQVVAPQRRRDLERRAPGQVAVALQPLVAAERVVQHHPRAHVGPLPVLGQRVEDRQRPHEVRAERVQEQRPLAQRLAHQAELALLQVAQPAVDELARPAGGAGREVTRLDERGRQPARGRVERRAGAGRACADHHDVEDLALHPPQGGVALTWVEPARHSSSLITQRRDRSSARRQSASSAWLSSSDIRGS